MIVEFHDVHVAESHGAVASKIKSQHCTANIYSEITVETGHMQKVYTLQVLAI